MIHTNIQGREFETQPENYQEDITLQALKQAFLEIDELKDANKKLNDKLNAIRKSK